MGMLLLLAAGGFSVLGGRMRASEEAKTSTGGESFLSELQGLAPIQEISDSSSPPVEPKEAQPEFMGDLDGAGITPPKVAVFFPPFYPLSWRMNGIEGAIELQFIVDKEGKVREAEILSSTAQQFNSYALEAAKNWRFVPAAKDGQPFAAPISFPVAFVSEFGSGGMPADSFFNGFLLIDDTFYFRDPETGFSLAEMGVTPLQQQAPVLPQGVVTAAEEAEVVLTFTVNEDGQVIDPEVVEASHPGLEEPALAVIRYWRFIPKIEQGKAQATRVRQPIKFSKRES